jgi:hypothetical protein
VFIEPRAKATDRHNNVNTTVMIHAITVHFDIDKARATAALGQGTSAIAHCKAFRSAKSYNWVFLLMLPNVFAERMGACQNWGSFLLALKSQFRDPQF